MLSIDDLAVAYGRRRVVENVYLELGENQSCAIVGASGTGKSSILSAILGFIRPTAGTIRVDGADLGSFRPGQWRRFRRETVSAIFQHGELIGEMTPVENVAIAPLVAGVSKKDAFAVAEELLADLGMDASSQLTSTLSGGEQQRVAVARALATKPRLILADEPTASLDQENRDLVGDLLLSIPARWQTSVLIVTHDDALARQADTAYSLVAATDVPSHWTRLR